MSDQKPTLVLLRQHFTAEDILAMFRVLTGRQPTPAEVARVKAKEEARKQAQEPPGPSVKP